LTPGYWKNHPEDWTSVTVTLGNVIYTQAQLLDIFGEPVQGNCLISLAHQLIAAKLNIQVGSAAHQCIDATIAQADQLIGNLVVPPVSNDSLPCNISGYIDALDNYNQGEDDCADHCKDSETSDPQPFIQDNPCVMSPTPTPTANP